MLTHADECTDTEAAEQHVFVGVSSDFVVKVSGAPVTGGEGRGGLHISWQRSSSPSVSTRSSVYIVQVAPIVKRCSSLGLLEL